MFELADHLIGVYKTYDVTKSITVYPRQYIKEPQTNNIAVASQIIANPNEINPHLESENNANENPENLELSNGNNGTVSPELFGSQPIPNAIENEAMEV